MQRHYLCARPKFAFSGLYTKLNWISRLRQMAKKDRQKTEKHKNQNQNKKKHKTWKRKHENTKKINCFVESIQKYLGRRRNWNKFGTARDDDDDVRSVFSLFSLLRLKVFTWFISQTEARVPTEEQARGGGEAAARKRCQCANKEKRCLNNE